jgi:opacity protein-like surface antigen
LEITMMSITKKLLATAGMAAALLLGASAAQAEMLVFKAAMAGTSSVPANDSAGTGMVEMTVDTDTKKVSWTMTADGLSGAATAAHAHGPASATETAPPVIDMSGDMMMKGSADITEAQWTEMKAGKYYVNVHTEKFPDGEIRGQLEMAK